MRLTRILCASVTMALSVGMPFLLGGCKIGGSIDRGITILDKAIGTLDNGSKQWQQVLRETQKELVAASQSTLSNEVSNLASKAVSDIGVETKCYTDFMRDRVKEDLKRLRSNLTGESINLMPVFCKPTPTDIDYALVQQNRQNSIEIAGYNLDSANLKVILQNNSGNVDVSTTLANPSRYLLALNLGSNGVTLKPDSQKILFKDGEKLIATINVIQPIVNVQSKVINIPDSAKLCPDLRIKGDREFDGNGPAVQANAQLVIENNRELYVKVFLHVKETDEDDGTEAQLDYRTFPVPLDFPLTKIESVTPNFSETSYTDTNAQLDFPPIRGGTLVNKFEINGDTAGDDVGNCKVNSGDGDSAEDTYVKVYYNPVTVRYIP
jgi:hypothetical protein